MNVTINKLNKLHRYKKCNDRATIKNIMDTLTPSQRHNAMSHIRSTNSIPERTVRSALHGIGFRFRKNDRRYPGTPDIVLPHYHAVIFVNGCFWHGHGLVTQTATARTTKRACQYARLPKTNTAFWQAKIERNKERDRKEIEQLLADGWRVCVVWECAITGKNRAGKIKDVSERISLWLEEGFDEPYFEI